MRTRLAALGLAVCLPLSFAAAQERPAQAPPAPAVVVQFLGFSETQAAQFLQHLQNLQGAIGAIEQQLAAQRRQLETLLNSEAPDPAALGAALLQIRATERQAGAAFDAYHQAFLALLTQEQKDKVQAVANAAQLQPAVRAFAEVRLIEPPR